MRMHAHPCGRTHARASALVCTHARTHVHTRSQSLRDNERDIEKEIASLRREEVKLVDDIKAAAKKDNQAAVKILAKQLVQVRNTQVQLDH